MTAATNGDRPRADQPAGPLSGSRTGPRTGPLAGIRVLDLTRVLAGPFCTQILGDLGAEIVKIEDVAGGDQTRAAPPFVDGLSHYFVAFNRNKASVALDLKQREGREALLALAADADVLVENFRPGVMAALGLTEAALRSANPRLVICAISGFGQRGALRDVPAYDIITQAMSGVMSINGEPGGPPQRLGLPLGDLGGGLWAAIGILAALRHRDAGGAAATIDLSLLDGLVAQLGYLSQLWFLTGESPASAGNGHHSIAPYGCYAASDGWLVIAAMTPRFFENFAGTAGRTDWLTDPRFATPAARKVHRDLLDAQVRDVIAGRPRADWVAALMAADVPCAAVASIGEALEQPVLRERGLVESIARSDGAALRVVGSPIRFGAASVDPVKAVDPAAVDPAEVDPAEAVDPAAARHTAPPAHGADTVAWLTRIGLSGEQIRALEQRGIIKTCGTMAPRASDAPSGS
ncbi:MAG: CaiB/BaiF CoA transferase family protein [Lautropia sp.]